MKTKLGKDKLKQLCRVNSVQPTKDNMLYMAFFNDAQFREDVTRLMFDRCVRAAKEIS